MQKLFIVLFFYLIAVSAINAQVKDYELGTSNIFGRSVQQQGGFFDYSDPETVNIKVSVWGFVRFPGRYLVPIYTTPADLISLAGGPTTDANLYDLRIYRVNKDSTQQLIKFSYNDLLWEKALSTGKRTIPKLDASDILLVPGEPKLFFRENFSIWMSVISALVSLSILVLNIVRK